MTKAYDAVVVGAGVVGCSIANALAQAKLKTLNIDALPAPGYGSTSHSSAIIRPFYSHITSCAVAHESRSRWRAWPEFLQTNDPSGFAEYHETGGMVLIQEGEESTYQQNLAVLDAVGVEYQLLDADAIKDVYPEICLDSFAPAKRLHDQQFGIPTQRKIGSAIHIPACGHVSDPQLATHNLYHAAVSKGAEFRFNASVVEIVRAQGNVSGVVLDNAEKISTPIIVNAAGPHSSNINQLANITKQLPITTKPHRHEVAYVARPKMHNAAQAGFLVDLDTGIYQRSDGANILIGSADPPCDPADIVNPDDYNNGFTEQWTLQVYRAAQRFPKFEIESKARGTVGLYDVSDDWIPVYDKTDLPGYYLAIGTSGNQFKNAPMIGDILRKIILTQSQDGEHDQDPCRLLLPSISREVDLSFYSRLRKVQATQSVLA